MIPSSERIARLMRTTIHGKYLEEVFQAYRRILGDRKSGKIREFLGPIRQ